MMNDRGNDHQDQYLTTPLCTYFMSLIIQNVLHYIGILENKPTNQATTPCCQQPPVSNHGPLIYTWREQWMVVGDVVMTCSLIYIHRYLSCRV